MVYSERDTENAIIFPKRYECASIYTLMNMQIGVNGLQRTETLYKSIYILLSIIFENKSYT